MSQKHRVAAWKYFSGDVELENVRWFEVDGNGRIVPNYPRPGGVNARFGTPIGASRGYDLSVGTVLQYRTDWLKVDREIRYLTKANPHVCDWRCTGAKPKGDCECACGGLNHGRGYRCEAA